MCNSWTFSIYQTLWKKLTDNQISQNKKFNKTNFEVILSFNDTVLLYW